MAVSLSAGRGKRLGDGHVLAVPRPMMTLAGWA